MRKNLSSKLTLNRESLHRLERRELGAVNAASGELCTYQCPTHQCTRVATCTC
jgi:hypothetical protein